MDEKINIFIDSLERQLEDLPQAEIKEAVSYYEEYLNDAVDEGKDLGEAIEQLGTPEKIASTIRAEASFSRAQKNPGLKNFSKVMKNASRAVSAPFAVFFMSIFIIILYAMVIMLYAGAFAAAIGALAVILGFAYEALSIPSAYILEIAGALGAGIFGAGLLMLTALGFYILGRQFIRASAATMQKLLKKPGNPSFKSSIQVNGKKSKIKWFAYTFLILTAAGLLLFFVSGLPFKYFTIFNSMKPDEISTRTYVTGTDNTKSISIHTEHSCIKLERGTGDKISINYEQPDWLDYDISETGGILSFSENSNGRLPLFWLAKIHESRTEVTVEIPEGYSPQVIEVDSTGGFVSISGLDENINVKTYTGGIDINTDGLPETFNIKADTENGTILVRGARSIGMIGSEKSMTYNEGLPGGKTIVLKSSRGNISIN